MGADIYFLINCLSPFFKDRSHICKLPHIGVCRNYSVTLVSEGIANIQTTFNPPLYLQANRNYELAMVNLETYYSFANFREGDNNSFKWSVDGGKTWTILHDPTGCYELKAINAEIIRIRGNSDITILPNVNTLQCILTVVGAKCKVSFDVPNSLANVLGFKRSIYGVGRHASGNLVNIMSVNSILVHCNSCL